MFRLHIRQGMALFQDWLISQPGKAEASPILPPIARKDTGEPRYSRHLNIAIVMETRSLL
jgi:hypothetical protein